MKTSLFLTFCLILISQSFSAQQYIFGKVTTEENAAISGVQIVNLSSNEIVSTDLKGMFMIAAKKGDLIRIVSSQFVRKEFRTSDISFTEPINITLARPAIEIEEVKISFVPSGNFPRDVRAVEQSARVQTLNNELRSYVMKPMAGTVPTLSMPQTLNMGPNYSAGQVNVIGLLGAAVGLVQKATAPKLVPPTYYETQQFYAEIRKTVDRKHFIENGLDEFQFDQLIAFADERYSLALKYSKNFDHSAITSYLKSALKDFIISQKSKNIKSYPAPAEVNDAA